MNGNHSVLFCSESDQPLGQALGERLGVALSPHEERIFADGEIKIRPLAEVQGRDVYILSSPRSGPFGSVHDELCRLLFFVGSIRDAGAYRVTLLAPYLCYSRKDRKTKLYDPTSSQYVARLLEAMKLDGVVTIDVHNLAAFQNAFRIPTFHLEGGQALVESLKTVVSPGPITICSPDLGGIKRAQHFRDLLSRTLNTPVGFSAFYKERSEDVVKTGELIGKVEGHDVIIVDDMIVSGTTMVQAAAACLGRGAKRIFLAATHALFSREAPAVLLDSAIECIFVTNTLPENIPEALRSKVTSVDISPLLARFVTEKKLPRVHF